MKKSMFSLMFLIGFAAAASEWNEGFYFFNEIPAEKRLGIQDAVLHKSLMTSGAYSYIRQISVPAKDLSSRKESYCGDERTKVWFEGMCAQLDECIGKNVEDCKVSFRSHCGGVVIGNDFFVTAKHCVGDAHKEIAARFLSLDGSSVVDFPLERLSITKHSLPYDIAVLKIQNWAQDRPVAEISSDIRQGTAVVAIGFPSTRFRENRRADYPQANNEIRVSIGRITEANPEKKSFCGFSNDIFKAEPESWILETACAQSQPYKTKNSKGQEFTAREERNVLLTNTDMIHGMSGSALYNSNGGLIGIGTTILKGGPPLDYSPANNAVYLKAENIHEILSLQGRK